jgi:surface protein
MKTGTLLASVLVVGSAVGHMATPSAVTACYEGGGPAEGYVHKETNLDFTVDRSSEKSVAFTESYNKFEGVSCSAVPAHKFGETAWCNTNGALCNRECPMSMPQKCADVDSFGVCTPTVKDICDTLQGSRDSCTSSSDAAQAKADDYLTVDVRASPCDGDEQSSTLNALKAYKVAYNNWATAFNNASQVCKVGETIRDYNGQSFMALHKNVDQVAKAAAAVCSEDDFNAEGSLPNLGSSEKNKAICEKMNNDLAKLSEDSQTSSKQIQCFSSKCQELSGKEATAFADMKAKFETFQANYDKYFAAAEGFNAKVEDKNAKLAAVQAAHVQLAEVKAATGAKFTKDYEVYHKFETGAANGNCGLTACEMESVCGYDIEADASAYVEKDANGKCRGKTVDLVEHCYAEVADDKAKAAAEKVVKRTRVGEFVGGDPTKLRNAVISCERRFGTDPNCDINTWDVSKMTSFNNLFKDLRWFNEPIGDWDTSQVTTMAHMFWRANKFNQPIGNWDTSKVTDMN